MLKIVFAVYLVILGVLPVFSQANCVASEQPVISLLSKELNRSFKTYSKQKPAVYYLSYTYTEEKRSYFSVNENGINEENSQHRADIAVTARAGSPQMDNTRTLKNDGKRLSFVGEAAVPLPNGGDNLEFRRLLWYLTHKTAEKAQSDFHQVQADSQTASERQDNSDDFVFPPKSSFCHQEEEVSVDIGPLKERLVRLSNMVRGHKEVLESDFYFVVSQGHRYFVDSVGSEIVTPFLRMRLAYTFEGMMPDGLALSRGKTYDVLREQDLPDEQTLKSDMEQSLRELQELKNAPEAEPVTVPAILKNRAMAVFVHEVLGHRMEGHRQKQDSFGKTFTDKVGQLVTAPFITIMDDATLPFFNGEPLRGFYEYDDEGVKVRPVTLVENGVLREFLMSSSPIKGFPVSNGHGRRSRGESPVARMGVTRLISSQTVSYAELEKKLLEEIKRQHKPYGYVIDDLSGGFTMTQTAMPQVFKLAPQYVYRLYPDGRKEVVRGADIVGTPLVSFSKILATADDYAVFNGTCGAESGWVPVSSIAPSVLLEALEVEKTAKGSQKPPILPAPIAILKGEQK